MWAAFRTLQGFGINSTVGLVTEMEVLVQGSVRFEGYNNMNFGALSWRLPICRRRFSGIITQTGNYTISGSAASHGHQAQDLSVIHITQLASTITISGTPAFSTSFVQTHGGGAIVEVLV